MLDNDILMDLRGSIFLPNKKFFYYIFYNKNAAHFYYRKYKESRGKYFTVYTVRYIQMHKLYLQIFLQVLHILIWGYSQTIELLLLPKKIFQFSHIRLISNNFTVLFLVTFHFRVLCLNWPWHLPLWYLPHHYTPQGAWVRGSVPQCFARWRSIECKEPQGRLRMTLDSIVQMAENKAYHLISGTAPAAV